MPAKSRALVAALIVLVAALLGAAYTHREADAQTAVATSGQPVATFELPSLLPDGQLDQRLVENALTNVEQDYYKPVNAQTLVDGEQKALREMLSYYHVTGTIPAQTADGDRSHDIALLEHNVDRAETLLGSKASKDEVTTVAIRGMMEALGDPYTVYMTKREIDSLQEQLHGGDFGGIGVYIVQDPKTGQILVDPIEGNPAFKAGIKPGDVIISVDGTTTKGLKLDAVEKLIRGHVGTVVAIGIHPHNSTATRTVDVTRGFIHVPSVKAKMEGDVDYIRLADFGTSSYDEVRKAMLDGKAHNAKGYILDLRNNGGGLLEAAVQISSLFIPDGTIVSTIDRAGDKDSKDALHTSIGIAPLVILVNKYTASASEITAGAAQDYHAATIVGTQSFGKGVVQSIYTMPGGSALKITTARYVTPLGRDIQHRGITPDVVVPQTIDPALIDTPKDKQLAAAKHILQNGK